MKCPEQQGGCGQFSVFRRPDLPAESAPEELVEYEEALNAKTPDDKQLSDGLPANDAGNAKRLARRFPGHIIWVQEFGWMVWDGTRYDLDRGESVLSYAQAAMRSLYAEAANESNGQERAKLLSWAVDCQNRGRLMSMLELAKPICAARPEAFDAFPHLLNCANVIVDLQTGEVFPHEMGWLMRKLTPVRYALEHPTPVWDQFLLDIFEGDESMVAYLYRLLGYCATGETREQVWALLHGIGANGKSTLMRVAAHALGEYACYVDPGTFLENRRSGGGPTPEIARLAGARLVLATEPERGRHLAEAFVKRWTGEEKIVARHLHREPLEFLPTAKIMMGANHLPLLAAHSHASWRRVHPIPFKVMFSEDAELIRQGKAKPKDDQLWEKLEPELPGILAKFVRGSIEWYRIGLLPPAKVAEALAGYKREMDPLADFIESCCDLPPDGSGSTTTKALREAYEGWCEASGADPIYKVTFARNLKSRGLAPTNNGVRAWRGIILNHNGEEKRDAWTLREADRKNGRRQRPPPGLDNDPYAIDNYR